MEGDEREGMMDAKGSQKEQKDASAAKTSKVFSGTMVDQKARVYQAAGGPSTDGPAMMDSYLGETGDY